MKLRRRILISCIIISVSLFIEGVTILSIYSGRVNRQPDNKIGYTQIEMEKKQGQNFVVDSPVNIVILGLDEEGVRSDVIVLLNFSPSKGSLNILSIARDTKINVRGRSSKINALIGMGGERLVVEKIQEITRLTIDYYVTLNFAGFRKIVDTLDGVQFNVPIDMDYDDPEQNLHIHLRKGWQVMDGNKAEQFVRYRKGNRNGEGYTDGDIGRIKAQQEFIKALIDQKIRLKYISKADDIFYILKKYMKTNIEIGDVNRNLKYLMDIKYDNIKTFTLPGEPSYVNSVWYFICDKEKTRELIDTNFFRMK